MQLPQHHIQFNFATAIGRIGDGGLDTYDAGGHDVR